MKSFISWVGGKSRLAKQIVERIPPHKTYVEAFGGAGWVLFAKPKEASKHEVYNDLNGDLVNLFKVIRDDLAMFKCLLEWHLNSREEFEEIKRLSRQGEWQNQPQRAAWFYLLIKASYGSKGGVFNLSKTKPSNYRLDVDHLTAVKQRLRRTAVMNMDFEALVRRMDGPETFIYLDPPYYLTVKSSSTYYQHTMTPEDHKRLADVLKATEGKWLMSYDNHPWVRRAYKGFKFEKVEVSYSLRKRTKVTELLISNY